MGNASGRESEERVNAIDPTVPRSNGELGVLLAPPDNPSPSPFLFTPQVPISPLHRVDSLPFSNQMWQTEPHASGSPPEQGIPTIIAWIYGGNEVAVEGSWDRWTSRKILQRSGKDHSVLLVLPSGIYHYKFIVDGEWRYIPDLPIEANEAGVCNVLDVHNNVPEIFDSITAFEGPPSPDSSYGQTMPSEEDFSKEPVAVPLQLPIQFDLQKSEEASSCSKKPRHVVLNHMFMDTSYAAQSVVALGVTHRFESKYVTVFLYKPLKLAV
ncbi:hypothetical protein Patl1_30188 [Pistacia atlantica]|uniref:Uncharacterized protein n=1 Tax=Pistacia atlantica TaxID=434234 RepID=A0ACC1ABB4_9ROSI|nr:hypothetical protein Patl1_30188 [Pistacia atlantica]